MNSKQERFFSIARNVSLTSDFSRARVGAIVVEKNKIISAGHSANKTSPVQYKYNKYRKFDIPYTEVHPKVHAEIAALAPLLKRHDIDWSKVSIYVYRELKDGTVSCSRPCSSCMFLIRQLGIRSLYYTDWDGSFVHEEILK